MSMSEYLGVVVAAVGVGAATLVGLAHAGDQGRQWAKSTSLQLLAIAFYLFLIVGGVSVIWSFGAKSETPTRGEILVLLLWIFNGGMGVAFAVSDLLNRRRALRQAH